MKASGFKTNLQETEDFLTKIQINFINLLIIVTLMMLSNIGQSIKVNFYKI
jgi:hypothetical protein